jgi:hypothetical protein
MAYGGLPHGGGNRRGDRRAGLGSTGLLGAEIEDGTAIGEGREGVGVARHAGECGLGSFYVSGPGRAGGRAEAGRRS